MEVCECGKESDGKVKLKAGSGVESDKSMRVRVERTEVC